MNERTKTYIAADWVGDKDAVDKLYEWSSDLELALSFIDPRDLIQEGDGILNSCTIRDSMSDRLDTAKAFVLIVGNNTKSLSAGSCHFCGNFSGWSNTCTLGRGISIRGYIEHECKKAVHDGLRIVVLYNATSVDKSKCPDVVKDIGTHEAMRCGKDGEDRWDYQAVREALPNPFPVPIRRTSLAWWGCSW